MAIRGVGDERNCFGSVAFPTTASVVTVEPAGKAPFVNSCMHADEANGSIQLKTTHEHRSCV